MKTDEIKVGGWYLLQWHGLEWKGLVQGASARTRTYDGGWAVKCGEQDRFCTIEDFIRPLEPKEIPGYCKPE